MECNTRRFLKTDKGGEQVLTSVERLKGISTDQDEDRNSFLVYLRSKGRLQLEEAGKGLWIYHFSSHQGNRIKVILYENSVFDF